MRSHRSKKSETRTGKRRKSDMQGGKYQIVKIQVQGEEQLNGQGQVDQKKKGGECQRVDSCKDKARRQVQTA